MIKNTTTKIELLKLAEEIWWVKLMVKKIEEDNANKKLVKRKENKNDTRNRRN